MTSERSSDHGGFAAMTCGQSPHHPGFAWMTSERSSDHDSTDSDYDGDDL
jgi:hypothetical protein